MGSPVHDRNNDNEADTDTFCVGALSMLPNKSLMEVYGDPNVNSENDSGPLLLSRLTLAIHYFDSNVSMRLIKSKICSCCSCTVLINNGMKELYLTALYPVMWSLTNSGYSFSTSCAIKPKSDWLFDSQVNETGFKLLNLP